MFSLFKKNRPEPLKPGPPQVPEGFMLLFVENLKYISSCEVLPEAIARQFVKSQSRYWLTVGAADFPTGRVVVTDPLSYLPSGEFAPCADYPTRQLPGGYFPVSQCDGGNPHLYGKTEA